MIRKNGFCAGRGRKDSDLTVPITKGAKDIILDPIIQSDHLRPEVGRGWWKVGKRKLRILTTPPRNGFLAGHLFDQVSADHAWRGLRLFDQAISIEVVRRKNGFHGTPQADMLCDRPSIHAFHAHDAVSDQVI